MGQMKISEMQLAQQVNKEDYIPIVQGGANKKISAENLMDYNAMKNKPQINGKELSSENSLDYLEIQPKGNYVTKEEFNANDFATSAEVEKKLDKNLGKENSQKVLQISETGEVKAVEAIGGNNVVYKSEVAEPAIINDSFNKVNKGIEIYGQSEQASTTGAQLFDPSLFESNDITKNGIHFIKNSDGSISIIGTSTGFSTYNLGLSELQKGTYYINGTKNNAHVFVYIKKTDDEKYIENNSFTIDGTETSIITYIQINPDFSINDIIYPMLNLGDTSKPFEPYTGGKPSPSPDYPQEIISKEINEIKVTGVNVLKLEDVEEATKDGITYSVKDGLIKVKGTAERDDAIPFHANQNRIALLAGQTYIFNPNPIKGTETLNMYLDFTNSITFGFSITNSNLNTPKTLNKAEADYAFCLYFVYKTGQTVDNEYKPQVLMSNVLLPYEPYKSQTITLTDTITLRGIPISSDGNVTIDGQQYISDVICEKDGVIGVERNIVSGFTIDGSDDESWNILENVLENTIRFVYKIKALSQYNGISEQLKFEANYNLDTEHFYFDGVNLVMFINKNRLSTQDITGLKAWLQTNPLTFNYASVTPTFEPLPEEIQTQIRALQMYYPTTIVDCGAPVSVTYEASLQTIFEDLTSKINESINLSNKALLYNKD